MSSLAYKSTTHYQHIPHFEWKILIKIVELSANDKSIISISLPRQLPFHIKYNLAYGANNNGENKEKGEEKNV